MRNLFTVRKPLLNRLCNYFLYFLIQCYLIALFCIYISVGQSEERLLLFSFVSEEEIDRKWEKVECLKHNKNYTEALSLLIEIMVKSKNPSTFRRARECISVIHEEVGFFLLEEASKKCYKKDRLSYYWLIIETYSDTEAALIAKKILELEGSSI